MGYSTSEDDPHFYCQDCKCKRSRCTCKPKCEFRLSDEVTKQLVAKVNRRIEGLCRHVREMGWGYRLAVSTEREKPEPWNSPDPVVYQMRYCILIPGQSPPPGRWTVYGPWKKGTKPMEAYIPDKKGLVDLARPLR